MTVLVSICLIGGGGPPGRRVLVCSAFSPGWWAHWVRKSLEGFFRSTEALKPPGESLNVWEVMVPQERRTHRKIQPEADFLDAFDVISEQFRIRLFFSPRVLLWDKDQYPWLDDDMGSLWAGTQGRAWREATQRERPSLWASHTQKYNFSSSI